MADSNLSYYLAGPMTGLPNHNFDAFEEAATLLRARGLTVLSPHDQNKHLTPAERDVYEREHWVRLDLRLLLKASALVLLPRWEQSLGARRELDIALDLRYPVFLWSGGRLILITGGSI